MGLKAFLHRPIEKDPLAGLVALLIVGGLITLLVIAIPQRMSAPEALEDAGEFVVTLSPESAIDSGLTGEFIVVREEHPEAWSAIRTLVRRAELVQASERRRERNRQPIWCEIATEDRDVWLRFYSAGGEVLLGVDGEETLYVSDSAYWVLRGIAAGLRQTDPDDR